MKLMQTFFFFPLILQEQEIIWVKLEDAIKPQQFTVTVFLAFIVTYAFLSRLQRETQTYIYLFHF